MLTHPTAGVVQVGDFAQTPTGRMLFEIGGTDTDELYRLHANGTVKLGGVLEGTAVDGFVLEPGDEFTILTCAGRTGSVRASIRVHGAGDLSRSALRSESSF